MRDYDFISKVFYKGSVEYENIYTQEIISLEQYNNLIDDEKLNYSRVFTIIEVEI